MEISTNTWHYKLAYHNITKHLFKGNRWYASDFCTYFRHVLKPLSVLFLVAWTLSFTPIYVYNFIVYGYMNQWPSWEDSNMIVQMWALVGLLSNTLLLLAGVVGGVGMILLLIIAGVVNLEQYYKEKYALTETPRQPNIFVERYKAFKDKVCPLVTFEDK